MPSVVVILNEAAGIVKNLNDFDDKNIAAILRRRLLRMTAA
jgi:hypothetical protein